MKIDIYKPTEDKLIDINNRIAARLKFIFFFALIAFQAAVLEAHALPALDSSFGNSGIARIGVPDGANDTPSASALQRDGKLLLAGQTRGRQSHAFVLRLLANGALDTTFGQDGVAFVDLPNGYYIYAVGQIEQGADGSILVSGASTILGGGYSHVFARLTTAGVLDTSFGTQGFFSVEWAYGISARFVQQADGGLLIVSDATQGSQFALRLTRFNRAGVRDSAYAPNGEKILGGLPPNFGMASDASVVAEPDGGFTLMARATINPGTYLLVRVTDTGTLDVGFGNAGLVSGYDIGNPFDKPVELVRTANGGLLLKGDAADPPPGTSGISLAGRKIVLWRVTAAGLADVSFGVASRLEVGSDYENGYFRLAVLSDGSIALVNTVTARVMHFDASGVIDSAFGTAGSVTIALSGYAGFNAIGVLPNSAGGLLIPAATNLTTACGFYCYPRGVDAVVASLDGSGRLQSGYGRGDGFAVWNNAAYSNDKIDSILVESSGKVMLAGTSDAGATFDYLLARLTANGSPDNSFGTNGRVSPRQYSHFIGKVRAVEQASGAITVVTGTAIGSYGQVGTVTAFRLDSTGTLDAGFVPTFAAPSNANTDIALGVRPDGRLLYGTTTYDKIAILQQTMPDGTPDLNFGAGGKVVFPLSAGEFSRQADMVLLGDGSVVFAVLTTQNLHLYKIDPRGLPVASFGTAGQFAYAADFSDALSFGQAFSLLSLTDGSLLAGIDAYAPSGSPNGLLAIRISERGMLVGANNLLADQSYLTWSFAALPDASVVIARSRSDGTTSSAALYRLLPDNSLDGNFGLGGAFPLHELQSVSALAIDANGRILVAGQDSTSAILARYQIDWPTNGATVIEFYNTNLDHYFITADSSEAAAIDGGSAGSGWTRTGNTFKSGGDTAVCRFYGSQSPGPNSHFYTLAGSECDGLKLLQASTPDTQPRWNFESLDFVSTPANNGTCPSGTTPVYRAYNNGFARGVDSNHRISSSTAAIQEVVNRGWSNEGVVMCAPN